VGWRPFRAVLWLPFIDNLHGSDNHALSDDHHEVARQSEYTSSASSPQLPAAMAAWPMG